MKKQRRIISLLLIVALIVSVFPIGFTSAAYGREPPSAIFEYDYVPDQLLVVMDERISSDFNTPNGSNVEELFPDLGIVSVNDLTDNSQFTNYNVSTPSSGEEEEDDFPQILLIELNSSNENDMLEAIETLEQNPLVESVSLNYVGTLDSAPVIPNDTRAC